MGSRVETRKASWDATDSSRREGSRFNTFGLRAFRLAQGAAPYAIGRAVRVLHRHPHKHMNDRTCCEVKTDQVTKARTFQLHCNL